MKPLLLALFLATGEAAAQDSEDLKRDMIALELYLQDQKDHKEYCPTVHWEQPAITVYKETLKSQLPEGCKE